MQGVLACTAGYTGSGGTANNVTNRVYEGSFTLNMASKASIKGSKKQPNKVRKQCFKTEYSSKWDFVVRSGKGETFA